MSEILIAKKPTTICKPPTFVCMICGKFDDPNADIVDSRPWICNRCARKLKLLLYGEEKE